MEDYSPHEANPSNSSSSIAPTRERITPGAGMRPSNFAREVAAEVTRRMAKISPTLNCEVHSRLVKFWYCTDQTIHYELALHESTSQLEIGLHAESLSERNRAFYAGFDRCMVEVQRELGTSMWLENWDRSWARLYETQPLWPLDSSRVSEIAERIAEVISVLEPIYRTFSFSDPR